MLAKSTVLLRDVLVELPVDGEMRIVRSRLKRQHLTKVTVSRLAPEDDADENVAQAGAQRQGVVRTPQRGVEVPGTAPTVQY